MTSFSKLYLAFCLCILATLAWADWRGWAPKNCQDQYTADWTQAAETPFSECGAPASSNRRSLRNRSYRGGK